MLMFCVGILHTNYLILRPLLVGEVEEMKCVVCVDVTEGA